MTVTQHEFRIGTDRADHQHAAQHAQCTTVRSPPRPSWVPRPLALADPGRCEPRKTPKPREYFIQGITLDGHSFRPSDWAERLAGAMSCFRPDGVQSGIGAYIGYSPYCVPRVINGVKCVIVNEALKAVEPMAWDFVMHFARDNKLQLTEACVLPDALKQP